MATTLDTARPVTDPVAPRPGVAVAWGPAAAVLVAICVSLVVLDTPVPDVLRYLAYVAWALVLPGVLVYRTLRSRPHSLFDDLVMGTALGLALEVVAWVAFTAIGVQSLLWLWPLAVAIPYLVFPSLRRRWRTPQYSHQPSLAWRLVVGGILGVAVLYIELAMMWTQGPTPAAGGTMYNLDLTYLMALAADAKHHLALHAPGVASEPMPYHFFPYAHQASGSWISGVDLPISFFRLDPVLMVSLAAAMLVLAGWRVSTKPWVGALAGALFFVVGELALSPQSVTYLGTTFAYYSWVSPSTPYGYVFAFALMAVIVSLLRGSVDGDGDASGDRPTRGAWVLFSILAVAAAGAKSTIVPILLAGLALAGLVELIRRRRIGRDLLLAGALVLGAQLFAVAVLFRFQSSGLAIDPIAWVRAGAVGSPGEQALVYAGFAITYCCYMFARVAGIPVMARLGRPWDRRASFLLGAFIAGWLGTMVFSHPGLSQNFFMSTGYGFGAVLSAMGFAALVERHRVSPRVVALIVASTAVGAYLFTWLVLAWPPPLARVTAIGLPGNPQVVSLAVLMALAGIGLGAVWWFVRRRVNSVCGVPLAGLGSVILLSGVLVAGVATLPLDARQMMRSPNWGYHTRILPVQVSSARWLRDHSAPDDLVATNDHCVYRGASDDCYSLVYWINAYAERRTLVGGWEYTNRIVDQMREAGTAALPFWDQNLLAANDAMFSAPTEAGSQRLRGHGVRWLVVNRTVGVESSELGRFAVLRHEDGPVAIYELS